LASKAVYAMIDLETPLLRNRDFILFAFGRALSVMGLQALTVAIGWHVYQLTKDPLDLGLVGLAQFAPAFVFFLAAGIAADRFDRRQIMAVCSALHVLVVAALLALLSSGNATMGPLLALLGLHGIARAFYHTASQSLLPQLVPTEQFPNAIAWSSSASKAAQLLGPAVAGGLIAWIGDGVYWPILASFLISCIAAMIIQRPTAARATGRVTLTAVLGGFNYIWREKIVLGAISIDLMAVLFGGVMGLLPIYASDILHVGPAGLGWMRAMPGVGSLIVGLALAQLAAPRFMGPMMFGALALFGVSVIVFSVSEIFWLSMAALFVYGAADMISVYVRQTLVQIATPDAMRGRVSAVNSISINASNELGDFRAGIMAAGIGVVPAVLVGGVATCAITGLWAAIFPSIRKIDRLRDVEHR
jgi:MFS family permease